MVLPFDPLHLTFHDLNYYVDLPKVHVLPEVKGLSCNAAIAFPGALPGKLEILPFHPFLLQPYVLHGSALAPYVLHGSALAREPSGSDFEPFDALPSSLHPLWLLLVQLIIGMMVKVIVSTAHSEINQDGHCIFEQVLLLLLSRGVDL